MRVSRRCISMAASSVFLQSPMTTARLISPSVGRSGNDCTGIGDTSIYHTLGNDRRIAEDRRADRSAAARPAALATGHYLWLLLAAADAHSVCDWPDSEDF